jgi:hypothetical protein
MSGIAKASEIEHSESAASFTDGSDKSVRLDLGHII